MSIQERCLQIQYGQDKNVYEFLGSHLATENGIAGCYFRAYAPHAKEIYVMGDFNAWNTRNIPLTRIDGTNVWQVFVPKARLMQKYKYVVIDKNDKEYIKSDPYAYYGQTLNHDNDFASYIYDLEGYKWKDSEYFEKFNQKNHLNSPMNIYEVCLLTWKKHADGSFYTYKELANTLIPYCKRLGYTHIELLPMSEFPNDISWGYQVAGYFAITSRYGSPKDFMYFIDKCHEAGLGVILDWVPAHFDYHDYALKEWDGEPLYESPKWDRKLQLAWSTRIFDYEDPYVTQFLISSALFYMRKYHFDGIRVDACVAILYLDFARQPGEWIPNVDGNNINYAGVEFLKQLNNSIYSEFPNALMIAEEVSSWPMVTKPTTMGGLGFNFKWNVGWINDIWEYTSMDPCFRRKYHKILTHTFDYCFEENYVLPVDHDEVGNGRHSLIGKMNGDFDTKLAMNRAFYTYMAMHPGKKLSFMGSEFGQITEWHYQKPINFTLLKAERNKKLLKFITAINSLYLKSPEMYEIDFEPRGFEWLVKDDGQNAVIAFKRYSYSGSYLICVCNFSPYEQTDYVLGVDEPGEYHEIFSSDAAEFGGNGNLNETMHSLIMNKNGKTNAIRVTLPANSAVILKKV